jgi:formylglycine-generating enzyme required for sulfatase activity
MPFLTPLLLRIFTCLAIVVWPLVCGAQPIGVTSLPDDICNCQKPLVFVKGGTFEMGSNQRRDKATPVHTVTIDDYYIGAYEVTVCEFTRFVLETGYKTTADTQGWAIMPNWKTKDGISWKYNAHGLPRSPEEDFNPVTYISWNDASEYCKWLSKKSGLQYRLPTEAEWEYAARGGNLSQHHDYLHGHYYSQTSWTRKDRPRVDHRVGGKLPNELGLYDMTGNVWEWCQDWYAAGYAPVANNNPTGPAAGENKVLRGGAFSYTHKICTPTYRNYDAPNHASGTCGFRIARNK